MKVFNVNNNIELRQLSTNDIMPIFDTINTQREHLGKWLPFVQYTQKPEDTAQFVTTSMQKAELGKELINSIYYQGEFIGLIGFNNIDLTNKRIEMGYWLSQHYQHKGIITLSCKVLIHHAFTELDINRIQIRVAKGNFKSMRVPERLGFIYEGTERDGELLADGFTDVNVYSLLKRESAIV